MYYRSKCNGCGKCLGLCHARSRDPEHPERIRIDRGLCTLCGACVDACPKNANEFCGEEMDVGEIFSKVLKDRMFYEQDGGMTLSGGEPALQPEASLELARLARDEKIGTVIETSGFGSREFFEAAAELGVTFFYDIKEIDPEKHRQLTGVPNTVILNNLGHLMDRGAKIVLRLPLIPGVNDADDDLELLSAFLRENRDRYDHAEIMKYHTLGMSKAEALSREYLAPGSNADADDAARWLKMLSADGKVRIRLA